MTVVPPVSPGLSEAASVVAPVLCVGGRGGDGGVAGFKRGLMVAVVVLLLVTSFVRVKPVAPLPVCFRDVVKPVAPLLACFLGVVKLVAPLLVETGCFSGETARRWCHRFQSRGKWW